MSVNVTLLVVMGALFAAGIYLLLERSLTRVMLGLMLLTNAVNILLLSTGGYAGLAPLFGADIPASEYNDPLPQALILTAIVIGFAVTAFMLGLIYRSWVLSRQDEVRDDLEDRRVAGQSSFDPEDDADLAVETTEFTSPDAEERAGSQRFRPRRPVRQRPGGQQPGRPPRQAGEPRPGAGPSAAGGHRPGPPRKPGSTDNTDRKDT